MLSSAITVVVVLSAVLGVVVGGMGPAWPGDASGAVGERAVGLPSPGHVAGYGVDARLDPGGATTVGASRVGGTDAGIPALNAPITTLDFERLPDGTRLEDGARLVGEYEEVGVVFTPRETFAGPTGAIAGRCSTDPRRADSVVCSTGYSGDTVVYTPLVDEFNRHPLGVEFGEPQQSVSLFVHHYDFHELPDEWPDAVGELVAFDARGQVITRDRVVFGPTDGWQELAVDGGRQGIASVEVWFDRGGTTENWFVVDDLQASTEPNAPPEAVLTYAPLEPHPGEWVDFDSQGSSDADGRIVRYDWAVARSDGTVLDRLEDSDDTVPFQFDGPGEYRVSLTVFDDDEATDTETVTVVVRENESPVARIDVLPSDPRPGERIVLDAVDSSDADGRIVSYDWRVRGTGENPFLFTFSSRIATTYEPPLENVSFPGEFDVTLTVTDDDEATDTETVTVVVSENEPPIADIDVSPTRPAAGTPVEFDGTGSFDPDGTIVGYEWRIDGATVGDGPRFTHEFPAAGQYDVTLAVTDDREAVGLWTETVVVEAIVPPAPRIEFSPAVPVVGELVTFDATSSTDDGRIVAYEWDLDDDREFERTGPVVERRYATGGTYRVRLLVVDDNGLANTTNATVRVNEPPVAAFRIEPSEPRPDERVTFDASPSTDDGEVAGYAWDFDGDGRVDATGRVVRHTFETAGERTVRLTVRDDDGVPASTTRTITVPRQPTPEPTPSPTPTVEPTPSPTATSTTTSTPGPGGGWPTLRDATTAVGAAVAVGLVVLFRDEIAVLLRELGLPRTTPRRGRRPRPARNVPDPAETDDGDDSDEPNRPPTASIRYRPTEPTVGRPVHFDGLGSVDPDGRVVGYRWSFEDGPDRRGATVVHTFEEAGERAITLSVTDDDGATGTTTATVEVDPAEGELALVDVHPDAPGRKHLQQEYLVFGNVGDGPLDVVGWTVHDAAEAEGRTVREGDHRFEFTDVPELEPGATLTLHTGEAPATGPVDREDDYHRYWGRTWFAVWNDDADVVLVRDAEDNPVFAARYERVGDGYGIEPLDHERLGDLFPDAGLRGDSPDSASGT